MTDQQRIEPVQIPQATPQTFGTVELLIPLQPVANVVAVSRQELGGLPAIVFTAHTPIGAISLCWPLEVAEQIEGMLREARGGLQVVSAPSPLLIPGR